MDSTANTTTLRRVSAALVAAATVICAGDARAEPSKLPPEVGWDYGEQTSARQAALGGAVRALGPDITGLFTNPANMASTRVYHLAAIGAIWPEANRQSYGAAAVDSVTSRLAGGIGGAYTIQDPDGLKRKVTDIRAALAFPVSEKLYFGASAKYLKVRQDGTTSYFGKSYASGGIVNDSIVNGFSFDAGVSARPTELLSIGMVGTNLTNAGNGFRPLGFGGGIGVGNRDFSVEGDVAADFTTYEKTTLRWMAGAELLAADRFPLRAGYRYDAGQKTNAVSGGVGYLDQQFAIEASVRRTVSGDASTTIIIGLQYFLESSGITRSAGDFE